MYTVCVLMSTYNGEKFLIQQVDSILNQKDVKVHLVIRDDGSTDYTLELLDDLCSCKKIEVIKGKNIGCEESFYYLIKYAEVLSYDYFAFADQDDIWYTDKIANAISNLSLHSKPALYCCNQKIVDTNLNELGVMVKNFERTKRRMQENYFSNRHGCTMVWNSKLAEILKNMNLSEHYIPVHDKWVNLVARCCGVVILDNTVEQIYRIHEANHSGLAQGLLARIQKGIKLYWVRENNSDLYAKDCIRELQWCLKERDDCGMEFVYKVAGYKDSITSRFRLIFSSQIRDNTFFEFIFWAISILIGKY